MTHQPPDQLFQADMEVIVALHDRLAVQFKVLATRDRSFQSFLNLSRSMLFEKLSDDPDHVIEFGAIPTVAGHHVFGLSICADFQRRMALTAKDWFAINTT